MYNFVNSSNYYSPGNYFRLTQPGSGYNKYAWGITECYNCTLNQAVASSLGSSVTVLAASGSSTTTTITSSGTSTAFSSGPSSTISATSAPSGTPTSLAKLSSPSATVTTFSAPPLLTACGVPTAAQFHTNGCVQSGYPTATSALLAVTTGIATNAIGDYNFDPEYQRCASICAGLPGCQGYALGRNSTIAWNCIFYSQNTLLRTLTTSSDFRSVVWKSLLCFNCPVPAPASTPKLTGPGIVPMSGPPVRGGHGFPASGVCVIYSVDIWDAIGDSAVAGRAYKDYAMDEPACWTCPTGMAVHHLRS